MKECSDRLRYKNEKRWGEIELKRLWTPGAWIIMNQPVNSLQRKWSQRCDEEVDECPDHCMYERMKRDMQEYERKSTGQNWLEYTDSRSNWMKKEKHTTKWHNMRLVVFYRQLELCRCQKVEKNQRTNIRYTRYARGVWQIWTWL